ncbi:MAG: hypothetical protein R3335_01695 [Anaerolineales bacterium]|nr:hypothetical protein [Anaerolineales bacterium]
MANAVALFEELKDSPVRYWGFKDVGLSKHDMESLVRKMNTAGKTTCLEVVSLSESEGLRGARLAIDLEFDILMGTVFYESIANLLRDTRVKYFPFAGEVSGHPSILNGTVPEIVHNAQFLEAKGVDGLDLLTFRYSGDALQLLTEVVERTAIPIVSAGSISSFERIVDVWHSGASAFTIGTACFEGRFVPEASFGENMMAVWNWLQSHELDPSGQVRKVS